MLVVSNGIGPAIILLGQPHREFLLVLLQSQVIPESVFGCSLGIKAEEAILTQGHQFDKLGVRRHGPPEVGTLQLGESPMLVLQ